LKLVSEQFARKQQIDQLHRSSLNSSALNKEKEQMNQMNQIQLVYEEK